MGNENVEGKMTFLEIFAILVPVVYTTWCCLSFAEECKTATGRFLCMLPVISMLCALALNNIIYG